MSERSLSQPETAITTRFENECCRLLLTRKGMGLGNDGFESKFTDILHATVHLVGGQPATAESEKGANDGRANRCRHGSGTGNHGSGNAKSPENLVSCRVKYIL